MTRYQDIVPLSLSGPESHILKRESGVGNLSIGPEDSRQRPDLVVDANAALDWACFDGMATPSGTAWPRSISYEGNDLSLFSWMTSRQTEDVCFTPRGDLTIDAGSALLQRLTLQPGAHTLRITLPATLQTLRIVGDPGRVKVQTNSPLTKCYLVFEAEQGEAITSLNIEPWMAQAPAVAVENSVVGAPFDCRSLLPLTSTESIRLHGQVAHLDALAKLPLRELALRFVADLSSMPSLHTWPGLTYFIAWNIDEVRGKALRQQARALKKAHVDSVDSEDGPVFDVSKLRSPSWFIEEFGLPFSSWPPKAEKKARKAFRSASRALDDVQTTIAAKEVFAHFIKTFNSLASVVPIETSEREDIADALALLSGKSELVDIEDALALFDELRNF